jgi:uncharacterized protein (TIGR03437 family)
MVPSAVTVGPGMPTISPGGVITASAFGASSTLGPGSWIEIYGSNLAADSRLWTGSDFTGVNAPISLDRTEVLIGGEPAFVEYVSPNQVNAQIPSDFPAGTTPLVVRNALGTSAAVNVTVTSLQPEFYAPTQLLIGGKQYIGALDGATFVAPPGSVPGLVTARAHVGDVLTLYGIGFGDTNPLIPAGQVAVQSNSVMTFPQIFVGGIQAAFNYKGLAPGEVGLYQFNIVVPAVASSDLVPVTLVVAGVPGTQVLYTAIQNP